jgi:single-strand DNA-binding protein
MLNRAEIIGYLGRDPEARTTTEGTAVVTLSIATSEKWKDRDGKQQERTEWHRCIAWGKLAEICAKYLKKGGLVYVEGRLETQKWTDKEGIERYTTQVRMDQMRMLSGRPEGSSRPPSPDPTSSSAPPQKSTARKIDDLEDDIPF